MTLIEKPHCIDDLACIRDCPALRAPLVAGDFIPDWFPISTADTSQSAEHVARYRFPNSRESYIFSVRPCLADGRWYAWGDYSPWGRKITDACYQFLDGGGSFSTRSAAVWAIHIYLAHLAADDTKNEAPHSTPALANA